MENVFFGEVEEKVWKVEGKEGKNREWKGVEKILNGVRDSWGKKGML